MGGRVWGVEECVAKLRNIAERSSRYARRELDKEGEEVAEIARMNAPYKEGGIEDAIDTGVEYDDDGRKVVIVYLNPAKTKRGADVEEYGVIMHEWGGKWGEKSLRKWASLGRPPTGKGFFSRALEEREAEFMRKMEEAVERGLK